MILKPLLVLSVPHSGTMFTLDLLPGRRGVLGDYAPGRKYFVHLREPQAQEAYENCFTIVPVRHTSSMVESWKKRGLSIVDLRDQLASIRQLKKAYFLQIEGPFREDSLKQLSQLLECELTTDWVRVNASP